MGLYENSKRRALAKAAEPQVRIVKVKGEKHMTRTINDYEGRGWTLDQSSSRKALYSLATGVFTRKQIHTLTFRKGQTSPVALVPDEEWTPEAADARIAAITEVSAETTTTPVEMLKQLAELRDSGVLTGEEFDSKKVELLKQI